MFYTKKVSIKGRGMFYKENRLISIKDVPSVVLANMQAGVPYEYIVEGPQVIEKNCLFCGLYTNMSRLVDNKIVPICEEHYYSNSLGKVVQRLRERELVHES